MKKISLKDVKNGLKRDEMRVITGGSYSGGGGTCYGACTLYVNGQNNYGTCFPNGSGCGCSWGSYQATTCRGV